VRTRSPHPTLPPVDERLIVPDTRYELVDGEVVYVSPALEPHGSRHSKLSALLEAFVADGYNAASDMLTRTSDVEDFAPDKSIYPAARDPETGGRQLEELAFEVVSTETLSRAAKKAASLVQRGVRRVFAIDVERQRGLEWSTSTGVWEILSNDAAIEDPVLVLPLPIHDLVAAAHADDAVARALLAKNNPILAAAIAEGKAEGKTEAILAVLAGRGLRASDDQDRAIRAMRDEATLDRWLARAGTCTSVADLLRDPPDR
jgi:Uma2 family endonuclease